MLKKTPLYDAHEKHGARFTEFGGWLMPVQYSGLVDEHVTVRTKAGLFDVSHMGEVFVRGPKAVEFLERVTTNNVSRLKDGEAQYSLVLNEKGGVVDDIIIYRLAAAEYLICVNAGNTEKDWAWFQEKNKSIGAELENASAAFGQIALQGPAARAILAAFLGVPAKEVSEASFPAFTFKRVNDLIIAATGYTGEDGCEIFCPARETPAVWEKLMKCGEPFGLKPAGLGARDTLRLEACYPLHGHELTDDISPLCSGLGWVVHFDKDFIGKEALVAEKEKGLPYRLVGLEVAERGIIRGETKLFDGNDEECGWVASGTMTPTLNKAVGLGFVRPKYAAVDTELKAQVRERFLKVRVIKKPFYKRRKG